MIPMSFSLRIHWKFLPISKTSKKSVWSYVFDMWKYTIYIMKRIEMLQKFAYNKIKVRENALVFLLRTPTITVLFLIRDSYMS